MSTLGWIVVFGLAMSALALVGGVTTLLSERTLARLLMPLVALAAGSLLGGALFHMLPEAVEQTGNELSVYASLVAGFAAFFLLEQYLHWHHCHLPVSEHAPLGYLILVAAGLPPEGDAPRGRARPTSPLELFRPRSLEPARATGARLAP
jgi:zinc and cadmium transporter